ncbi:hypothetical protein FPSE_07570 [Fusarium pseudograminearum CS3096]|uniref:Pyruvate decarboxylase n=2 Tax=Fusarium pseudograminearum TaxID=101028 RepID=K3VEJ4_FUSPC|nr:hypothetical protein FPSE_07570 [Fusarium pseudograminearum CS3096]EKJ72249.1 hypothetical protein FPSE_07570 [Fusarium pseudograminearum CS3096]
MEKRTNLVEYLFLRLTQLGVCSVHGVPGDYNLTILDFLEPAGLHWVGNANELNAGYAADGYARIKGISALVTSFGVGELSAINAIGGAYSEKAPVVHILGDGNLRVFADVYKSFTVAQANLVDAKTAPSLIDEVLKKFFLQCRPVYIEIPTDMVVAEVSLSSKRIDLTLLGHSEPLENEAVSALVTKMQQSQKPLILVDGFAARFGVRDELNELVRLTGIPTLTTPFGKSLVDESLPNFHGVFSGLAGDSTHAAWVQSRDLVLHFGPLGSDTNTYGFTAWPNSQVTVSIEKNTVEMNDPLEATSSSRGIHIGSFLNKMIRALKQTFLPQHEPFPPNPGHPRELLQALAPPVLDVKVDQYSFWLRMSHFFRPGDVVMTETGTSSYGGQSFVLPRQTTLINSCIWLSIGYMRAASQGVALTQRDMDKEGSRPQGRTILFEGEGSLQMSAQAISDIIRNKLDIVIFVINNNGYAIERLIHGFNASYNDIQPWCHLEAPKYFGAPLDNEVYPVRVRRIETWGQLEMALSDPEIQEGRGLSMVEVVVGIRDAPIALTKFADYLRVRNSTGSP